MRRPVSVGSRKVASLRHRCLYDPVRWLRASLRPHLTKVGSMRARMSFKPQVQLRRDARSSYLCRDGVRRD